MATIPAERRDTRAEAEHRGAGLSVSSRRFLVRWSENSAKGRTLISCCPYPLVNYTSFGKQLPIAVLNHYVYPRISVERNRVARFNKKSVRKCLCFFNDFRKQLFVTVQQI